ncbi:MAG TPA: N-methyl-D-aspartate receptor NMDAR2C subunit [Noviherbaspirillum sp.]|nr:N-methyl-D-aspartate receptor NMDAR2C subunit [Noviherbaspirillum sp.]
MFVHTAENQSWLRARWQALMTHLGADRAAADSAWDAIVRHYSEPQRAYHNLSHVMALLRLADTERQHINRPEVVELAIWFHDVIYDTRAHDNELRSSNWAAHAMRTMRIDSHLIAPVERCILATQRHEVSSPGVADLPLFLDIDLAILGAAEEAYHRYAQMIRAEYDWVPDEVYRAGRAQVLQRFLDRPVLYFTAPMAARFDARARQNIAWELQELSTS